MRTSLAVLAAVGLVAAGIATTSAFALAGDEDDGWKPVNGIYAFRQLSHEVAGTPSSYLRSECFAVVEPIQQGVVWQTGVVKVYVGAALLCNRDELRFTDREWTLTVTSQGVGLVWETSDAKHFETPWQPQGGTIHLAQEALPCRAVTPGRAGQLGWVKAELRVTLTDTNGRDWTAVATDYDGVICRPHRQ